MLVKYNKFIGETFMFAQNSYAGQFFRIAFSISTSPGSMLSDSGMTKFQKLFEITQKL